MLKDLDDVSGNPQVIARAIRTYGHGDRRTYLVGCECDKCVASLKPRDFRAVEEEPTPDPDTFAIERVLTPGERKRGYYVPTRHGTRGAYNNGCHCQLCRNASNAYIKEWRKKKKAKEAAEKLEREAAESYDDGDDTQG